MLVPSQDGNTALHLAAGAGLMGCVELLLSNGADLGATNENGQTPADLAKARGHDHIATSLEAKMVFSVRPQLFCFIVSCFVVVCFGFLSYCGKAMTDEISNCGVLTDTIIFSVRKIWWNLWNQTQTCWRR